MNKYEIVKAAREAGLPDPKAYYGSLERFAKLVIEIEQFGDADAITAAHMIGFDAGRKAERERCAKVCESFAVGNDGCIDDDWAAMCAKAIRASK